MFMDVSPIISSVFSNGFLRPRGKRGTPKGGDGSVFKLLLDDQKICWLGAMTKG